MNSSDFQSLLTFPPFVQNEVPWDLPSPKQNTVDSCSQYFPATIRKQKKMIRDGLVSVRLTSTTTKF
jgi:hypothetical protein